MSAIDGTVLFKDLLLSLTLIYQCQSAKAVIKFLYNDNITSDKAYLIELYRVFPKKQPHKTFRNIFTSVKSFCVKFCQFVGNLYPPISTNFCRFILIFHQMALIFPRVPVVFTLSSFEQAYSPRKCSFSEMTSFFVITCLGVQ